MTEREIQNAIRLALGQIDGACFFRNNVGTAEFRGATVRYGVGGPGGSDLIGLVYGRFCALEIKAERGHLSEEQDRFLGVVRRHGGFACVVRSVEEALDAVERARKGLSE